MFSLIKRVKRTLSVRSVKGRGSLNSMQYAKGRYAERKKNIVISYADLKINIKKLQLSTRNTTRATNKVKSVICAHAIASLAHIGKNVNR